MGSGGPRPPPGFLSAATSPAVGGRGEEARARQGDGQGAQGTAASGKRPGPYSSRPWLRRAMRKMDNMQRFNADRGQPVRFARLYEACGPPFAPTSGPPPDPPVLGHVSQIAGGPVRLVPPAEWTFQDAAILR